MTQSNPHHQVTDDIPTKYVLGNAKEIPWLVEQLTRELEKRGPVALTLAPLTEAEESRRRLIEKWSGVLDPANRSPTMTAMLIEPMVIPTENLDG